MKLLYNPGLRRRIRSVVGRLAANESMAQFVRGLAGAKKPGRRVKWVVLDAILNQAGTLEEFLRSPALIEQYYRALSSYFGAERFPRCSFDAILAQLRTVSREVPGFNESAWRRLEAHAVDFELETAGRSTGRDLNLPLWKIYRFQWISRLRHRADASGTLGRAWMKNAADFLAVLDREVHAFERSLGAKPRRERDALRSEFYRRCKEDPKLRQVAAAYLYRFLTSDKNQHFFQLADADLVVQFFKELKQNPRRVLESVCHVPLSGPLMSSIKALIPNSADLLADRKMFPLREERRISQCAAYRTRAIRPFHGVWLGIVENDCLAGDPSALDSLTPERWAVSVLEGSLTCVIERNGIYQGFVRCVPLADPEHRFYGSLEVWAPLMISRILFKTESGTRSDIFFNQWFPKFSRSIPEDWDGVIVSDSVQIDNSGVKRNLVSSGYLSKAVELGRPANLRHIDLLVNDLKHVIRPQGRAPRFCGDMVFDAKIPDAQRVWKLQAL